MKQSIKRIGFPSEKSFRFKVSSSSIFVSLQLETLNSKLYFMFPAEQQFVQLHLQALCPSKVKCFVSAVHLTIENYYGQS